MTDPVPRPKGRKAIAWYRGIGLSIAWEAGVRCVSGTGLFGPSQSRQRVRASYDGGCLELPNPTSHRRLFEFACGCGRIALELSGQPPDFRGERMAEQWAVAALGKHGIGVPPGGEVPQRPGTHAVQEGRKAAARRYRKVAADLAFEAGVEEVVYDRRSLYGMAYFDTRRIRVPEPTTRRRLFVFAHECGHIALVHDGKIPQYRQEYEAEQWAIAALRRHGVAVPRKELDAAKGNVAWRIRQEVWRGTKPADIDREAMRFAGLKARQLRLEKPSSAES